MAKARFHALLDSLEIILTPMTNAPGYKFNKREE
jgi:hypothetical protein